MRLIKYTILFLTLLFVSIPYVVQIAATSHLEKKFGVEASIENVRFNVFTGETGLEGVHIYSDSGAEFHLGHFLVDIDLGLLFERKLYIESLALLNVKTQVTEKENFWNIGGIVIPVNEGSNLQNGEVVELKSSWQFGIGDIEIENADITFDTQKFKSQVVVKSFKMDRATDWGPNNKSLFELLLLVNKNTVSLKGDLRPFSPSLELNVFVDVQGLLLTPLIAPLVDPLMVPPISATQNNLPYSDIQATLFTALQLSYSMKHGTKNITLNGELALVDVFFNDLANEISVKEEKLSWDGDLALTFSDNILDGTIESLSNLKLSPLRIETIGAPMLLGALNRFELTNIRISSFKLLKVDNIFLQQFIAVKNLSEDNAAPLSIGNMNLSDVRYLDKELIIDKIDVVKLQSNLIINPGGGFRVTTELFKFDDTGNKMPSHKEDNVEMTLANEEGTEGVKEASKQLFPVKIQKLNINTDSSFNFVDNSVTPAFETKINKIDFELENVDTRDDNVWTTATFSADIDDYGHINFNGKLQPFSPKLNAKFEANIKNLALVPFSSYSGKYADLFIKRGSANSHIKIDIVNDKLNIKNNFQLNKLKLESGDSEVSKSWMVEMPMPLNLTLDVLRDKNDIISLDIPIKGKISDPDFHLQSIYSTAMTKALRFAATYYITQAVQPLGLIISAGKLIGKAVQPRFESLEFDYGSVELSAGNKSHLTKLAKLFIERPKLSLTVCAISVENDWLAIKKNLTDAEKDKAVDESLDIMSRQNRLLKLASSRSQAVKRYIVDTYALDPARINECSSKIDKDLKAIPTVELSL
ncbi:MAG: DUF748 domain-containing protein [Gammaproteobacteria bacterium]|nr:DUF748 domain-containing protein [Gammaproteobacteria bacterium]